jgi:hypothetical protein
LYSALALSLGLFGERDQGGGSGVSIKPHCWMSNTEHAKLTHGIASDEWAEAFNNPSTCMLPDGHAGPHQWTPDGEIEITFLD